MKHRFAIAGVATLTALALLTGCGRKGDLEPAPDTTTAVEEPAKDSPPALEAPKDPFTEGEHFDPALGRPSI